MSRAVAVAAVMTVTLVAVPGVARAELGSTTTVNGETPPGTMAPLANISVVVDTLQNDGTRLLVQDGIRKPGTRNPIQYHQFDGQTCVVNGTLTHFVEGRDPVAYPPGSCYETAPGIAMTAANLGSEDARLVDTFVLPADAPGIIVIEPGWPDLTDPTG